MKLIELSLLFVLQIFFSSSILQEQQYDSFTQECFKQCLSDQQCNQYACQQDDTNCLNSQNKFNNCFKTQPDCQEVQEQYQLNQRISEQVLICMQNCTPSAQDSPQFYNNFKCQDKCLQSCADAQDKQRQYCQNELKTGADMKCFNYCHQRRNCEQFQCQSTDIYCLLSQQNFTNCSANISACSNQYQAMQQCGVMPLEFQLCIDSCPTDPYYSQTFYSYQQCHRSCFLLCKNQGQDIQRIDFGDYMSLCASNCQNNICKDYETTCMLQDFVEDCQKGENIYNSCMFNNIKNPSPTTSSVIASMEKCESQVEQYLQLFLQKVCLRKCFTNKCGMAVSENKAHLKTFFMNMMITILIIILLYK